MRKWKNILTRHNARIATSLTFTSNSSHIFATIALLEPRATGYSKSCVPGSRTKTGGPALALRLTGKLACQYCKHVKSFPHCLGLSRCYLHFVILFPHHSASANFRSRRAKVKGRQKLSLLRAGAVGGNTRLSYCFRLHSPRRTVKVVYTLRSGCRQNLKAERSSHP